MNIRTVYDKKIMCNSSIATPYWNREIKTKGMSIINSVLEDFFLRLTLTHDDNIFISSFSN